MQKAVFLDRDGVLNPLIQREDGRLTSPWRLSEYEVFPYVKDCIKRIKDMGFRALVVTNQPGINDGDMIMGDLWEICIHLQENIGIDHVMFALNKKSNQYKPNPGMFQTLMNIYDVDADSSYLIGDRWKDIVPANKCSIKTILVNSDSYKYEPPEEYKHIVPDYNANDLVEAVNIIEMELKNGVR